MKKTTKSQNSKKNSKQSSFLKKFLANRSLVFVTSFALIGFIVLGISGAAPSNRCTPQSPYVQIHNNYAWAQWGTWATAGQKVPFQLQIYNRDQGNCRRETINVNITLPGGFTSDTANFSLVLRPNESQLKMVYITSPVGTPNGDYPITAVGSRTSSAQSSSETSYYKVYSSDTTAPTFYWTGPIDGSTVSGNVDIVSNARDDHMARKMELYIDGALIKTETNVGIINSVSLRHTWDTRGVSRGMHTILHKAYDDFGNVASQTFTYNVQ